MLQNSLVHESLWLIMVIAVSIAFACSLATAAGRRAAAVIPSMIMVLAMADSLVGVVPRAAWALLLVGVPVAFVAIHRNDRSAVESLAHRALLAILTAGFLLSDGAMLARTTDVGHDAMVFGTAPLILLVAGTVACVGYCVRGVVVIARSAEPFRRRRAGELWLMTTAMVAMLGMGALG